MVFLVVGFAIALYVILYFYGEYLTQNHDVGTGTLAMLQNLVFATPRDTVLALLKLAIGLVLFYLVVEALYRIINPPRSTTKKRRPLWRKSQ